MIGSASVTDEVTRADHVLWPKMRVQQPCSRWEFDDKMVSCFVLYMLGPTVSPCTRVAVVGPLVCECQE